MILSFLRYLRQLSRRLIVRVSLIAVLSAVSLGVAALVGQFLPDWVGSFLGKDTLGTILQVLASSMLAVTTFSLAVMVSAFQAADSQATPRSRLILKDDTVTQTVLASFVGAFLFSLIAIILRATPLVGDKEEAVLFGFSIIVVGIVIFAIIRWIQHLETLGSVQSIVSEVQSRSEQVMNRFATCPAFRANHWTDGTVDTGAMVCVEAVTDGYVQQFFEELLQEQAADAEGRIYVDVLPGDYVNQGTPLAYIDSGSDLGDAQLRLIRAAFLVKPEISLEQDPRRGLTVLTEIASRALSPGINDPQTAIDVVYRLGSLLMRATNGDPLPDVKLDKLWIRPLPLDVLYKSTFDVIARQAGETTPEVLDALGVTLDRLSNYAKSDDNKEAARRCQDRISL